MYIPKDFEVTDRNEILAFIKANAFGQLISTVEGRLFSSHIPFVVGNDGQSLICHIAKRNPQWKEIENQEVLITFQGNHDYISPSWYEAPGVPTWNYQTVHIYGKPQLITDTLKLKRIVEDLTERYESAFDKPWKPEYKETLLDLVIGIEIQISEFQCKYKLSQNRSEDDRKNVIEALQKSGENQLSEAMKNEL
jgi:transcriptional regulator